MSTPNEPPAPQESAPPSPPAVADPDRYYDDQPYVDRRKLPPFNVMALITFIGAFIVPVVGIVCGHITLAEYRRGLPERGREYAKAGLILGYIFTALWIVLIIVWIVFAFTHFGTSRTVGGYGYQPFGGSGGGSSPMRTLPPGAYTN